MGAGSEVIKTAKAHPGSSTSDAHPGQKSQAPAGNSAAAAIADTANRVPCSRTSPRRATRSARRRRDRYTQAIQSRRVYKEGKDGEREYLSDAEADAYRQNARKDVQDSLRQRAGVRSDRADRRAEGPPRAEGQSGRGDLKLAPRVSALLLSVPPARGTIVAPAAVGGREAGTIACA